MAWSKELGARGREAYLVSDFWKFVILQHRISSRSSCPMLHVLKVFSLFLKHP